MISVVLEKRNSLYIYNENGRKTGIILNSSGELVGFSSEIVCVQKHNSIYVYDEKGKLLVPIYKGTKIFHSCASTVNFLKNNYIHIYSKNGKELGTIPQ